MQWTDYVGEKFRSETGKIFIADSYDRFHGFWMSEVNNPNNRINVLPYELGRILHMVIDCDPPHDRSIKHHRDGWNLLERALFNFEIDIPIPEQIRTFREHGFSMFDIYLTIRAAQCIIKYR